ncbi:rod shape-determining protein MreB [Wenjunlia vitaminophila]|uniref:Cell shape-determining protein MreB n=1 Tax=Wenjunlia vitaminophila TaxID=76728 RepID=A0A0T6LVU5_WENVI|nr:rod shape-determining protein [Wenjunlia vitaminophila]KRV49970.1 rod shape-determining protein MreB [Wenjunlia vitaminophila]
MAPNTVASGRDIGMDLGTANTVVHVNGRGIVLNEPSVVAVHHDTGGVLAVGAEAKRMVGRTPGHIIASRPLRDGVIADYEVAERMMRYFVRKARPSRFFRPRVVVCVPMGATGVERRAIIEATREAGARSVHLIEEPLAAAIGADLPVHEAAGSMVVDIGGGTTDAAVISLGGIVVAESVRIAGDKLDEAIAQAVRREHGLLVGERTAEAIKLGIGSVHVDGPVAPEDAEELAATLPVRGRDQASGLPRTVVVGVKEIQLAIEDLVGAIVQTVKKALDRCPPELAGDLMERGIVLTGGGALLRHLDRRISQETGMPVLIAAQPLLCVALGSGMCLSHLPLDDAPDRLRAH